MLWRHSSRWRPATPAVLHGAVRTSLRPLSPSRASIRAVANGRQLITELREIRAGWNARITVRSDSAAWKVAGLFTGRPVVNSVLLRDELGLRTDHARHYLDPLAEAVIIVESSGRTRDRFWRAPEILDALDAFAERAGRRG